MRVPKLRRCMECGVAALLVLLAAATALGGTSRGPVHEDRALVTVSPFATAIAATPVAVHQALSLQRLEVADQDYIVTPLPTPPARTDGPVVIWVASPTPTPTPTRIPAPVQRTTSAGSGPSSVSASDQMSVAAVEAAITAAAQADGVDPSWMLSTSACESGFRWNAYNGSGPYVGIFQFLPSTFRAHGGTDIWSPVQQATIAASMFAAGEAGEWPVCSRS